MNGGYILIDCKGLDLTKGSTPQTITGIYKTVQDAYGKKKPIYADNCVWGTDGYVTPINVLAIQFPDYIICTASTLQIVITSSDVVTIINLVE